MVSRYLLQPFLKWAMVRVRLFNFDYSEKRLAKERARLVQPRKAAEADPEKATYGHDPKEMEAITTKIEKPGFRVAIRVVVVLQMSTPQNRTLTTLLELCPIFFRL